jgi:amino acid adenylation domain-containing protein
MDDQTEFRDAGAAPWQGEERHDRSPGTHLTFWNEYLAGAPTALTLPTDHPRPRQQNCHEEAQQFALSHELSAWLQELSRQEHVTLPVMLAAALETLLHRYTGQEDLLVGLTAPRRLGPDPQRPAGGFADMTILRADLAGQPSVREVLRRTRAATQATRGHQHVPFDAIVAEVQPERSPGCPLLVQVVLAFEPPPPGARQFIPCGATGAPLFDLCLEIHERTGELKGRVRYNSDLFDFETISRMIGHWQTLLRGMAAGPSRPVAELELLEEQETKQLLHEWSTGPEITTGPGIEQLIEEQARDHPEAVAVVCEGEQLSYRELDRRANQLARCLRQRGAGAEALIGVCLERSLEHVIALLGILKAGAVYVPLDPEAPPERIQYMMRDTGMALLLTRQQQRQTVSGTAADVVSLDGEAGMISRQSEERPGGERPGHEHLGYVIYTSGSTGKPKGVMVERGVVAAHCRAMIEEYGLGPQDRVLQFSSYSADASLEQILTTLASGAQLVMRGAEIWSSRQLLQEVKRQQVTVMNLSPTYWQQAVREWARAPQELAGTQLRLVILGGERVGAQAVQEWRELGLTGVRLLNAYGPTEATITATLADAGSEQERITIGRPLPGRSVYILDGGGRPVPAGVWGELHIGGPLLARGYLNRPDLTGERFVPDPFGAEPGGRLYRTGDLVRYGGDGRIEYLGRRDQQVKIRGFRIELGEVEAALAEHPAVAEAVVTARGDGAGKELVAYVVSRSGEPVGQALRGYLAEKLPQHMQPGTIAQLATLPRLATGKPDRHRLPEVPRGNRSAGVAYLAPRLMMQQQLVQIWEELLGTGPIGIRDNFFHLGGQSLLAAQLVDRIERACGTRLALSMLFAKPTVEQLAEVLQGADEGGKVKARVLPVQAEGSRRPFFFLHGDWTKGAFYCFALARACGPDQPFYVLEPYEFSGQEGAPGVAEIARAHIEAMRAVQAHGPYRLGGFCNGGLLAYEMALQLERAGEQVEFLGLINPSEPVQFSLVRAVCDGAQRARRTRQRNQADLFLRSRHAQRHIYRRLRPRGARVQDFGQLLAIEPRLEAMFPPRDALYHDYVGVFSWAAAGYEAGIYQGKITFFWARDEPRISQTWQPVTRCKQPTDTDEHVIPGTHMSCVADHTQDMAAILSECLSGVEQGARGAGRPAAGEPESELVGPR